MAIKIFNNINNTQKTVEIIFPDGESVFCKRITTLDFARYEPYITDINTAKAEALLIAQECIKLQNKHDKALEKGEDYDYDSHNKRVREINEKKKKALDFLCNTMEFLRDKIILKCVPAERREEVAEWDQNQLGILFEVLLYGEPEKEESVDFNETLEDEVSKKK